MIRDSFKYFVLVVAVLLLGCLGGESTEPLQYASVTATPTIAPAANATPSSAPYVTLKPLDPCFGDDLNALLVKNYFYDEIKPLIEEKVALHGYCKAGIFFGSCKQITGSEALQLTSVSTDKGLSFELKNVQAGFSTVSQAAVYSGNPSWSQDKFNLETDCTTWLAGKTCVFRLPNPAKAFSLVRDNNPLVLSLSIVSSGITKRTFTYACR